MRKSVVLLATMTSVGLLLGGCQSSLTGDSYSRDEARQVQTVRMGTIESLRPVKIEGTKTPIGAGASAVIGGIGGSSVGGGRGSAVAAVIGAGSPVMRHGSSAARRGTRRVSAMTSFVPFSGSEITAATVTSEPVPAVVGTA